MTAAPDLRQVSFHWLVGELLRTHADAAPVGGAGPAGDEIVRFRAAPSLAFPPADIADARWIALDDGDRKALELTCTFMGLYGPSAPLPPAYTERVMRSVGDEGPLRDFLDLFNHRFISLLYRAWAKYRLYAGFDLDHPDAGCRLLLALAGFGAGRQPTLDPSRLLRFLGLLQMRLRSACVLQTVISGYFDGLPTRVEEWVRRTIAVAPDQRTRLGRHHTRLADDFWLGERLPDRCGKVRLWLGPLDAAELDRFLPDGEEHPQVVGLLLLLLPPALAWDLGLDLRSGAVPRFVLGTSGRLGWTTWLGDGEKSDRRVVVKPRAGAAVPAVT